MPEVSVIIPNYNHRSYLKERIDSVLNQSFQDFEVIILDDHSTDNSNQIIEKFRKHPKITTILYNKRNSASTFKQWLKGISLANGKYIWIAESDDSNDTDFLKNQMNLFDKDRECVISYCRSKIIDSNSNVLGLNQWADNLDSLRWESDYVEAGNVEIDTYLRYRNTIPNASAVVFKKQAFEKIDQNCYLNMRFSGDWLIWVELLKQGTINYSSRPLNRFRVHSDTTRALSDFSTELKRLKEYFMVVKHVEKNFGKHKNARNYDWIIQEWVDRRQIFLVNNLSYLFPPFPLLFLLKFYKRLLTTSLSAGK